MSSSHLDRKELKRPDAFLSRANTFMEYISNNSRAFLALLAVLLLISLAAAFYHSYKTRHNEEANSALYTAKKAWLTALSKAPKTGDWESTVKTEMDSMQKLAKDYQGTEAGFEAELLIADAYFEHGNTQKALGLYKEAASNAPSRNFKSMALLSESYAQENLKDYAAAQATLKQVISISESSIKADAMMAMARNLYLKGDKAAAMQTYDQVIKDYPNSEYSKAAESRKNELK